MRDFVGYIWVCINRGVVKFDGYDFFVYSVEYGLLSYDIWGVFQDEEGKIWLFIYNEVLYFKDG